MGRLVGPVVAGHLAVHDPVLLPWALAAGCSVVSALVLLAVQMPADGAASPDKRLLRGFTDLGSSALGGLWKPGLHVGLAGSLYLGGAS